MVTLLASRPEAWAGAFIPGNLAVVSVSTTGASGAASAVSLLEYTTAGGPVQSIALPSGGGGARVTQSNSLATEGALSRSADGRYLTLVGYDAAAGTANVASTITNGTNAVPRVVARVGLDGVVDLSTTTTSYNNTSIRSAASADGSRFWTGGDNGGNRALRTIAFGGSGAAAAVNIREDVRALNVFNGQLYGSTSNGIFRTDTPLPTGTSATTDLPGVVLTNASGFVLLDRNAGVAGVDTLYVADQLAGLVKYSFDGSTWTYRGVVLGGLTGITGAVSGGNAVLYVTTGNGTTAGNELRSFTDSAAYNATVRGSYTTLATAAAGTAFRGVAFTPIPEPGSLLLGGLACAGLLAVASRRHRKPTLAPV